MDDLEFIQRCIKRDKLAWNEFVDKYSRLIYSYIHSVFQLKGSFATEDIVNELFHEVFILLTENNFKKLKSFKAKNGCSLASWLRQVTVNFTIDYIRKLRPTVSIDEEDEEDLSLKDVLADESPDVTDRIAQEERSSHLKDCIERLNSEDKYFLELHINRGLGLDRLKVVLGASRGAIDMRKSRLIERLRECFKSKGFLLDF